MLLVNVWELSTQTFSPLLTLLHATNYALTLRTVSTGLTTMIQLVEMTIAALLT